jgi:benzoyl-CoA reductase/2-hydroxyglutaryl-CoA dehydratase subunit BcrC/BadD/HgdB
VLLDFEKPRRPVVTFYLPRGEGQGTERFVVEELRALYARLEELTGEHPSDEQLLEAIRREERADALLGELWAKRSQWPLSHRSNRQFYELARSREYLPAEQFVAALQPLLDLAPGEDAEGGRAKAKGVPLLLSGIVPEPMAVLDVLGDAGAVVVADDMLCQGRRLFPPGQSNDPFQRMAQRLLGGPPDTTRGAAVDARVEHLLQLASKSGARAVLFFEVKFCEPEQFYMPLMRKALAARGIRSALVEVELSDPLPHQVITQIEALLETLS